MLRLFKALSAADRRSLLDYAEFLAGRAKPGSDAPPPPSEPVHEPRPDKESVVAAIKRLGRVYPMLDRERMLGETSSLMAGHMLQGRPAAEVIDDLEALFQRHYQELSRERNV